MGKFPIMLIVFLVSLSFLPFFAYADLWDEHPVVVWTYYGSPICNDGRNDCPNIEKTVNAIKDMGGTAIYARLTRDSDYPKLLDFLNLTKDKGIGVWVYMHYDCDIRPYLYNCTAWIRHLANLSLKYRHLQALTLDDLHPNMHQNVTPNFIRNLILNKNEINPDFKFIPVLYYDAGDEIQFFREDNPYYGVFEDGTSFFYWASYGSKGRKANIIELKNYLEEANREVNPIPFMTGIYTLPYGTYKENYDIEKLNHKPQLLRDMILLSKEKSNAICVYGVPIFLYDIDFLFNSTIFQRQACDDSEYKFKLSSSGKGTFPTWYQAIKTTVPASGTVKIRFDIRDNRNTCSDVGYQFKQLLVNNKVIWESDVCEDDSSKATIEKQVYVAEPVANITIRQTSKKGNWLWINTYVSNPEVFVNGTFTETQWNFESSLGALDRMLEAYKTVKYALTSGCGNGITEPGEACDGPDLNGYNCSTIAAGFRSGTLSCLPDCSGYDVSRCVPGNTIHAANCSQEAVQAAIDKAEDGDIVIVPEGECTWYTKKPGFPAVVINKSIILSGSGIDRTVITDNTEISSPESLISVYTDIKTPARITGFTFIRTDERDTDTYFIQILGKSMNWRVDHNKFLGYHFGSPDACVHVSGHTYGLIDHNVLLGNGRITVFGDYFSDNKDWKHPLSLGTANAVYIEDNYYNNSINGTLIFGNAIDSNAGARYVFRYNTLIDRYIEAHGAQWGRGTFSYEIYSNSIYDGPRTWVPVSLRGGTGVIFNNTAYGFLWGSGRINVYLDRACGSAQLDCACDGTCYLDGNEDDSGWPCRDQIGRSTDYNDTQVHPQSYEPLYEWNNTNIVESEKQNINIIPHPGCERNAILIQEGRDFFTDTPRPAYRPYPYPHPLSLINALDFYSPADTNKNYKIELCELIFFLKKWKHHEVSIRQLIKAIYLWKRHSQ